MAKHFWKRRLTKSNFDAFIWFLRIYSAQLLTRKWTGAEKTYGGSRTKRAIKEKARPLVNSWSITASESNAGPSRLEGGYFYIIRLSVRLSSCLNTVWCALNLILVRRRKKRGMINFVNQIYLLGIGIGYRLLAILYRQGDWKKLAFRRFYQA